LARNCDGPKSIQPQHKETDCLTCNEPEFLKTVLTILLDVTSLFQLISSLQELEEQGSKKNIADD
jgi:hypothetical protein